MSPENPCKLRTREGRGRGDGDGDGGDGDDVKFDPSSAGAVNGVAVISSGDSGGYSGYSFDSGRGKSNGDLWLWWCDGYDGDDLGCDEGGGGGMGDVGSARMKYGW